MARVLVVDDQKTILLQVEGILARKGHSVATATNYMDALDHLERSTFDLLITDIMLPGGKSGFDIVVQVRKDERLKDLCVIIMTGRRERRDVEKGIMFGTDDYIVKPLDADLLLAKIDSLISKKGNKEAFTEFPIRESAQWDSMFDIVGISEIGLTLISPLAPVVGTKVKLRTELFDKIGIPNQVMHVTNCTPIEEPAKHYSVSMNFIGLSEKYLQPIRVWVRSQKTKRAS